MSLIAARRDQKKKKGRIMKKVLSAVALVALVATAACATQASGARIVTKTAIPVARYAEASVISPANNCSTRYKPTAGWQESFAEA